MDCFPVSSVPVFVAVSIVIGQTACWVKTWDNFLAREANFGNIWSSLGEEFGIQQANNLEKVQLTNLCIAILRNIYALLGLEMVWGFGLSIIGLSLVLHLYFKIYDWSAWDWHLLPSCTELDLFEQ